MADKHKRFENEGVVFKAKLIGSELVMEPRGDKMCQNSIQRLKAIIKGTNSHKKRIVLKISYDGVKVFDEKTNEMLHHHEVSQVSYIASDDTDSRTFGYVGDVPNKAHQFICFKTSGPAINVMSVISALFEVVLEKKKNGSDSNSGSMGGENEKNEMRLDSNNKSASLLAASPKGQDSMDLIGDSGIMEGDSSIIGGGGGSNSIFEFGQIMSSSASAASPPINIAPTTTSSSFTTTAPTSTASMRVPPLPPSSAHHPIPRRQQQQHGILLPLPSSLPRPAPMMSAAHNSSGQAHNRSLVYNHSSVSLSDAALTRQASFGSSSVQNDSYVDRYAVFNDIDNLPSIFESTSLGSVNKVTGQAPLEPLSSSMVASVAATRGAYSTSDNNMFRQTNPFDDDFFA